MELETGDGWSTSEWFGNWYFENGWAYHISQLRWRRWIWLWRKEHVWIIPLEHASSCSIAIREKQDSVFFDYSTNIMRDWDIVQEFTVFT